MNSSAYCSPATGTCSLALFVLISAPAASVYAAGYLDELVVTGTRSERTVLDTPVRTEVVTAREIEQTHARNLKEALTNVPGLQLREIHGKPGYEVWLQGIDADRVLVLVDGMPLSATTGSAIDVSQLAVLDIERIEVVKGAVSAQYGSAAMGGVVNVIARFRVARLTKAKTKTYAGFAPRFPATIATATACVGDAHSVQVGADVRREMLEQYKDGVSELAGSEAFSREGYELWVQDTWFALDNLEVVTGMRGQRDSDFGNHFAPKVNARLGFEDDEGFDSFIRAGVGTGYRVPNLKERHYRFDHSQLGYIVNGNPQLEPESSVSYQLGFGGHFEKKVWFDINGFFNDIDDLVQTDIDQPATDVRTDNVVVYRYGNIDQARTWGVESTAGWEISDGWRISAGYTWTETEDVATGNELNRRPRRQLQASVDGLTGLSGLSWSLRARNQSSEYADAALDRKSPGYTSLDFKLNYRMLPELQLYAGVDNLTDNQRDFSDPDDFQPVAGRFLYTGFSLTLGGK